MLKKLNTEEIDYFIKKYTLDITETIVEVTYMYLYGLKTYLINGHYLLMDNGLQVVTNDLK